LKYPKAALDARISGYAGAEFQLDATGTPRNIKLICEQPLGYGVGQALLDGLRLEKYKRSPLPDRSAPLPDQWSYNSISLAVDTPATQLKH
jgi:hypothetical protein